ncbi:MAG: hypothetical protein ABR530_10620 [Pyrinomonadaceae bacterium]
MTFVKRPLGITILAGLNFIGAAFEAVLFILAVAAPETLRSLISALSPQGAGPDEILNLGPMLAVYFAVMAIVTGLIGYGLWTLRNWARIITMIIAGLSLVGMVVSLVQVGGAINLTTIILGLVRIGLCVLILWYLWKPDIRDAFRKRGAINA